MPEKKECFAEKLFLATLWAKLLIITVNFGNKTKVFSENFGWYHYSKAQTSWFSVFFLIKLLETYNIV